MADKFFPGCLIIALLLATSLPVHAAWEIGGKAGYDSNVNRTIDNATGDTFLGAYVQYAREASGETRLDWTFAASLEGYVFLNNRDLSNTGVTAAPGLTFFPYLSWSINVSPFVQGKAVADSDQTSVAFGVKVNLRQPLGKYVYLGEYYMYTDSRAQTDIYSYAEHAVGVLLGVNWTRTFFTEIGYEFSKGDSFLTFDTDGAVSATTGRGRGKQYGYSSTFSTEVYKDQINRHSVGLTAGFEIFPSFMVSASYMYSTMTGDLGTSNNHTATAGISYRF